MKYRYLLLCVVIVSLTACGPSAEQQATMTATAMTATAAAWTSTPTNTYTPTPTATAMLTPTPTSTPTCTPTPTATATSTITPTPTLPPGVFAPSDRTFTMTKPEGWVSTDWGLEYPALIGPKVGKYTLNITIFQDKMEFPLPFYAAFLQDTIKETYPGLKDIKEEFLMTNDGKDYFRWEYSNTMEGVAYHQVIYIFGPGDWKLLMTYTRPLNQGKENDALIDEAMKTVKYDR